MFSDIYWGFVNEVAKAVRWFVVGRGEKALLWELPGISLLMLRPF
jgi:hypothetical protein